MTPAADTPYRCDGCAYWQGSTKAEGMASRFGWCRKACPVADADGGFPVWPETDADDWCGDFWPLNVPLSIGAGGALLYMARRVGELRRFVDGEEARLREAYGVGSERGIEAGFNACGQFHEPAWTTPSEDATVRRLLAERGDP